MIVGRNHTVLIADTAVTERPTAEQYAAIAMRSSAFARRMGLEPRVAFTSYTTFGNPPGMHIEELRGAVKLLDGFKADFEYEGEMAPDVALTYDMQRRYLSVQSTVRPCQHPRHAGAPVGEPVRKAAARSSAARACSVRTSSGLRTPGADRADDGERFRPGDACGARRRRRARASAASGGTPPRLDSFDRADRFGITQRRDDGVQMREVVDLDIEVESLEAAVSVDELKVDDVGVLRAENAGHRA